MQRYVDTPTASSAALSSRASLRASSKRKEMKTVLRRRVLSLVGKERV
jgi:hypothetical protein